MNGVVETKQRVAVITGAGSGIGEETSYAFAKQGLSLVLVDMDADRLVKVADKLKKMGVSADKILTIKEDVSEKASYESIINQAISKFGQIDVLVNNAGYATFTLFDDLTVEIVDKIYKVLLRAPLFLSQKAFPHLKKTKGCIINLSSMASRCVMLQLIDYSTMKVGIEHLTKCLALEGSKYGIRVNAVHPGVTDTRIFNTMGDKDKEEFFEEYKKNVPSGRLGNATDIASAIVYLASEGASYVNGTSLVVDGGAILASPWSGLTTE